MPELLTKKSPAWKLYGSDFVTQWKPLVVAALVAVLPMLDNWATELLGGKEAHLPIWGGLVVGAIAMARQWIRDNQAYDASDTQGGK